MGVGLVVPVQVVEGAVSAVEEAWHVVQAESLVVK